MVIPAAALTETVDIQRFTADTEDAHGLSVGSWATTATLRARVEFVSADVIDGGQTVRQVVGRCYLDGAPDVAPTDRIVWEGRTFDVFGVLPRRWGLAGFVRVDMTEAT